MAHKLVFNPQENRWHLSSDGKWFIVSDETHACTLATVFPLTVAAHAAPPLQAAGTVRVANQAQDGLELEFSSGAGDVNASEKVTFDEATFSSATWNAGYYRDGWLAVESVLDIVGASPVRFGLFLPRNESCGDKELLVTCNTETLLAMEVPRGRVVTTDEVILPEGDANRRVIRAGYAEPVTGERRALGFLFRDLWLGERRVQV